MFHRLIIDSPSFKRVIHLRNSYYSIGRHPSNSIVIPSPQISRHHATLIKKINTNLEISFHIIDGDLEGNRSRNGIWVNGESYLEYELKHGDLIGFSTEIKGYYQAASLETNVDELESLTPAPLKIPLPDSISYTPQEQWEKTMIPKEKFQDCPEEKLKKLASIIEYSPYPIIELDYFGQITYLNLAAHDKFETLIQERLEHPLLKDILTIAHNNENYIVHREVKFYDKFFDQHIHYLADSHFIRIYIFDITERKVIEQSLNYQAFYDPLTELPNRFLFKQELSRQITRSQTTHHFLAIMFLGLRDFQCLNDTFGYTIADEVLCLATERLKVHMRLGDLLCRWRGDEFAILLTTCNNAQEVKTVAQRLLDVLKRPFLINNSPLYFKGNIGIALYPEHGDNTETLLMNANAALNDDQDLVNPNFRFYHSLITSRQSGRLRLEQELHRAIDNGEFSLHYQPQINIRTGTIAGMEALLRWDNPAKGLVPPNQFMNILETSGLIIPIGEQILRMGCEQQRTWQGMGLNPCRLSVNLSARQFQEPDLLPSVLRVLEQVDIDPSSLELEITETAVMQNVITTRHILEQLQQAGIYLALDDFGTGYSSLAYLKMFPFNTLKIDRAFIKDLPHSADDIAIIETILTLGRGFHLKIVAEGVETQEQAVLLQSLGCEEMQGYWFSKPLSAEKMTQFLQQEEPRQYNLN